MELNRGDFDKVCDQLEQLKFDGYILIASTKNVNLAGVDYEFNHDMGVAMLLALFESLPPAVINDFMRIAKNKGIYKER